MIITTPKCLTAVVLLALPTATICAAEYLVRPSFLYLDYTMAGGDNETGASLVVASLFGETKQHEVGLEVAYTPWSLQIGGALGRHGDGELVPILASYRYVYDIRAVQCFVGGLAGIARIDGDIQQTGSGLSFRAEVDGTEFAYGFTVGLTGAWTETVGYELGYRYLAVNDTKMEVWLPSGSGWVRGPNWHSPRFDAHVVSVCLYLRF